MKFYKMFQNICLKNILVLYESFIRITIQKSPILWFFYCSLHKKIIFFIIFVIFPEIFCTKSLNEIKNTFSRKFLRLLFQESAKLKLNLCFQGYKGKCRFWWAIIRIWPQYISKRRLTYIYFHQRKKNMKKI